MTVPISPSSSGSTSPVYPTSPLSGEQTGEASASPSYSISTSSSSQSTSTATKVSNATKRKRDESPTSAPSKKPRKEKHIKAPLSPSSMSQSSYDTDSDEEQIQARNFDPDACLCGLFGLSSLPPELSCNQPTTETSPNGSEQPSCSYRSPTRLKKDPSVSQLKYFNRYLLKAFQKQLHHEQKILSPNVMGLIDELGPFCNDLQQTPVLYITTNHKVLSHLDWGKLQAALQFLSVDTNQSDQRVGKEQAKKVTRILKIMCKRICKFKKSGYFIHAAQLTQWCGAALLKQNVQLKPNFVVPVKSCMRKFFNPPLKDRKRIFSNPQAFLTSRLAITLFQNRHSTRSASQIPSPPPSPSSNNNEYN